MRVMETDHSINVLGEKLEPCSTDPVTGFFRNGCCDTSAADRGSHTVCVVMTAEFLAFSRSCGNDLSTPRPEFGFDEYDGQVCDFDYVKDSIQPGVGYRRYYPAYSEHTSPYHPLRGWVLFDIGHDQPLALPRCLADNYRCVE